MEYPLYSYSLCVSLTLMLFFALYFIFAKVPDKVAYATYLCSRRIMGVGLLLLVANYFVHFFAKLRFSNPDLATFINLSTYFIEVWIAYSGLILLLDKQYLTRRRVVSNIGYWLLYTIASGAVFFVIKDGTIRSIAMVLMAAWFFIYAVNIFRTLLKNYRRAVQAMDDYYSDDVAVYIRWMSRFTYWTVIYVSAIGGLTFLPDKYVFLWVLSAIPFYIYLFVSYMNYLLFCSQVQQAFEDEVAVTSELSEDNTSPAYSDELTVKLERWIAERGFSVNGITINELAAAMNSNRTYLTKYIKQRYGVSFRDWVSGLRIEYAKKLLVEEPELSVAEIAKRVGYNSYPHFVTIFSEAVSTSPAKWRKANSTKYPI